MQPCREPVPLYREGELVTRSFSRIGNQLAAGYYQSRVCCIWTPGGVGLYYDLPGICKLPPVVLNGMFDIVSAFQSMTLASVFDQASPGILRACLELMSACIGDEELQGEITAAVGRQEIESLEQTLPGDIGEMIEGLSKKGCRLSRAFLQRAVSQGWIPFEPYLEALGVFSPEVFFWRLNLASAVLQEHIGVIERFLDDNGWMAVQDLMLTICDYLLSGAVAGLSGGTLVLGALYGAVIEHGAELVFYDLNCEIEPDEEDCWLFPGRILEQLADIARFDFGGLTGGFPSRRLPSLESRGGFQAEIKVTPRTTLEIMLDPVPYIKFIARRWPSCEIRVV